MAQIYTKSVILNVLKLLIVAATHQEVSPLMKHFGVVTDAQKPLQKLDKSGSLQLLITGVGLVNTAYAMGKHLSGDFNFIINAGICGAFNRNLQIGQVVNITQDCLSEMGAENDELFIPYPELGLGGTNEYVSKNELKLKSLHSIANVKGISVNKVHGNEKSIRFISELLNPDVESMEGAAFLMACGQSGCNYLQIRAISNYVEKRDKSKWNIGLAIQNLNLSLIEIITEILTSEN